MFAAWAICSRFNSERFCLSTSPLAVTFWCNILCCSQYSLNSFDLNCGNGVDRIVSGGLYGRATSWHPLQALKCLPTALSIPGHHTLVLRFCWVPTTPKWFLWARAKVLGHSLLGITMRVPINTSWPMTHISPTTVIYCLHFSNCPVAIIAFLASLSSSSSAELFLHL